MWYVTVISLVESMPDIHLGKYESYSSAVVNTAHTIIGIQNQNPISKVTIEYIPESGDSE